MTSLSTWHIFKVQTSSSSSTHHFGRPIPSKRSRSRSPLPGDFDPFAPLSSLISDHEKLASAAVNFVGWKTVESMLPPCLQGRLHSDVVQFLSDELDGMSRRRISCILEGDSAVSSSSSEVSEEDEQGSCSTDEQKQRPGEADHRCAKGAPRKVSRPSDIRIPKKHEFRSARDQVPASPAVPQRTVRVHVIDTEHHSDMEVMKELDTDASNLPDVYYINRG
ncbi:hypothetical protein GCK32_006362 [Trichostrongylus colubriformis]|uniref:Uncharacterized protein n=1 Tax=Trichostrongylus colubriformis TaxID=6319 RepID=A0AAN8F7S7_TRICO